MFRTSNRDYNTATPSRRAPCATMHGIYEWPTYGSLQNGRTHRWASLRAFVYHLFDLSWASCVFSPSPSGNVHWTQANANPWGFIPNIRQLSIRWLSPGFQHGSMQVPEEEALSMNILPLFFHSWVIHQIQPLEMEAGNPRSRFRDITQRSRQPQKRLFERDKNLSHSGNHFLGFGWDGRLRCRDPCE